MAITANRDKVRLEIGDTDSTAPLYQDDELDYFLTARASNIYLAAADACEGLARRYARAYDFVVDGQSMRRGQMSQMYLDLAKALRARVDSIGTVVMTRVDGYSKDIPADQTQTAGATPPRVYYAGDIDQPY